jgi:hypothetical protein
MEFYSADIEMLMSGWNTLYIHDQKQIVSAYNIESRRYRQSGVAQIPAMRFQCRGQLKDKPFFLQNCPTKGRN